MQRALLWSYVFLHEKEPPFHTCCSIQLRFCNDEICTETYFSVNLWTNSETQKHVTSISKFFEALHICVNYSVMEIVQIKDKENQIMNYYFQMNF